MASHTQRAVSCVPLQTLFTSTFLSGRLKPATLFCGHRFFMPVSALNTSFSMRVDHPKPNECKLFVNDCFKNICSCRTYSTWKASGLISAFQPFSKYIIRSYSKKVKEKVVKGGKKKVELTSEELDGVLELPRLQQEMQDVVDDLRQQLLQQVCIRTNISVYDNLLVHTPDGTFPLIQLGQVVQKNPSLILVNMATSPQYIPAVKEAIGQSGLNVNPQQDGTTIFIPVPKVTREYRENLARNAKTLHDKAKVRLRDINNKYTKKTKAAKDTHSEDIIRSAHDKILEEMHNYTHQIDSLLQAKEEELLGTK